MSDIDLAGGCQCGTVRYRVTAAATRTFHCHCSMCRKLHGAVFVTFSTVPEDGFAIERGEESLGRFESSPLMRRSFCTGCGCQLYSQQGFPRWLLPIAEKSNTIGIPKAIPTRSCHDRLGSALDRVCLAMRNSAP